MERQSSAPGGRGPGAAGGDDPEPLLLERLCDYGGGWRILRSASPPGWIAVQYSAPTARQALLAGTLTELSEQLSGHQAAGEAAPGGALQPKFVRAVLDDIRYTDMLMDALEARVVALEEVTAARGIARLRAARRLARSLRASVRPFAGRSFTERRYEAASASWGPP